MSVVVSLVLGLVGALLLLLPVLRVRIGALRIGGIAVRLTQPLDFGRPGPAVLSIAAGLSCLLAASLSAGLLDRFRTAAVPIPTPPPAEEIGFVQVDEATGRVALRLLQPDTMAGYTVVEGESDFEATVTAEALVGPVNAVSCIAFRASGAETRPSESYRAAGTVDWPRTGYMFCVSHLGMWALSRFDDGIPTYIEGFRESSAIRKTKGNRFSVRAVGDTFSLVINDVAVGEVSDTAYASGKVQVTCGTPPDVTPAAVCHFDDITLQPAP